MPAGRKRNPGPPSTQQKARHDDLQALLLRNRIDFNRQKAAEMVAKLDPLPETIAALAFLHLRSRKELESLLDEELIRKWPEESHYPRGRARVLAAYFGVTRKAIKERARRLKLR